jgi:hypothetical protein
MNATRPIPALPLFPLSFTAWLALGLAFAVGSLEAAPVVSNLTAAQRAGTKLVDISYDLAAPGFGSVAVSLEASSIPKFLQKARSRKLFQQAAKARQKMFLYSAFNAQCALKF